MRIRIIGAVVALILVAVGTFSVFTYVSDADARAANGAELVELYVVTDRVPAGTPGETIADYVEVDRLPRDAVQPDQVSALGDLEGLVTTTELFPGDQLVAGRFENPALLAAQGQVTVPSGLQEVTIALPVEQVVGGAIVPGAKVGVVITVGGAQLEPTSQFTMLDVLVTRIQGGDSYIPEGSENDAAPVSTIMVTVALATHDIERLVWAAELQQDGSAGIWLTLQGESTDSSGSSPVTGSTVFE